MDRRTFLQTGVGAALSAWALADDHDLGAQAVAPPQTGTQAPAPAQPAVPPRKLPLDAYSRHLQWLRTADEVADAVYEMACGGVMLTVQAYPGHIAPERVTQDLPPFVNTLRRRGLRVTQVRGPDVTDASAPHIEEIIRTGSDLGITHYWFGTFHYDLAKPISTQLDSVKSGIGKFVKLNEKYRTTVMFHTEPSPTAVGATVWDLLSVMKDFDPKYVGFHWDTGNMALHTGDMWEPLMRVAGPYLTSVAWSDRNWEQNLGLKGEGGLYPGPNVAQGGFPGGRGGRGGRGGARGGRGGRGGPFSSRVQPIPLPLAGMIARGNGWSSPIVPFGTGIIEVPKIAVVLRDIDFKGPTLLEAEYKNGGAGSGSDKITLPRQWVLGAMKRDVLTLRSAFMLAPKAGLTI